MVMTIIIMKTQKNANGKHDDDFDLGISSKNQLETVGIGPKFLRWFHGGTFGDLAKFKPMVFYYKKRNPAQTQTKIISSTYVPWKRRKSLENTSFSCVHGHLPSIK